jgi:PBSX family phage terminase large subunit
MQKRIELSPVQYDFLTCESRFSAFIGGIGSGKTFSGCVKDLASSKPGTLGLVVAPTYPMLRDATLRTFMDIAGDALQSFNKSDMVAKIRGGGEILFRSADNPDRLRGPNIDWAHMDEGAMCPPGTWEVVIGRLRAHGLAGSCWVTGTPNGRNWLYNRREQFTMFHARTKDNPYLAAEFIRSLEESYSGEFARQELDGEFISLEGLVYPMFKAAIHVQARQATEFQQWALAMDEGYTNPAVILLVGIDGDGRWHICREYYERGKLQKDVVATALLWGRTERTATTIAVDAAAAGLIADLRDAGLNAKAAKGRVLDGIGKVQARLKVQGDGKPRLTVDPSCVNVINEFESYVWKPEKDEPVKEHDHSLDALRYLEHAITRGVVKVVDDPFASW